MGNSCGRSSVAPAVSSAADQPRNHQVVHHRQQQQQPERCNNNQHSILQHNPPLSERRSVRVTVYELPLSPTHHDDRQSLSSQQKSGLLSPSSILRTTLLSPGNMLSSDAHLTDPNASSVTHDGDGLLHLVPTEEEGGEDGATTAAQQRTVQIAQSASVSSIALFTPRSHPSTGRILSPMASRSRAVSFNERVVVLGNQSFTSVLSSPSTAEDPTTTTTDVNGCCGEQLEGCSNNCIPLLPGFVPYAMQLGSHRQNMRGMRYPSALLSPEKED